MPNLTIQLDDETHRLAKIYAAEHGISLSQMFRDHIHRLSGVQGDLGVLARYSRLEISAKEAMDALGFTCLEDLMSACIRAGLDLPRVDAKTARQLARPAATLVKKTRSHA